MKNILELKMLFSYSIVMHKKIVKRILRNLLIDNIDKVKSQNNQLRMESLTWQETLRQGEF